MSSPKATVAEPHACLECLRRSWLLANLGPYFEKATSNGDGTEIEKLLRLPNEKLVQDAAIDAATINARIEAMTEQHLQGELKLAECWACCRHSDLFPVGLAEHGPAAPHALIGRGNAELLGTLLPDRVVTVVGTRFATSEGRDAARRLGREFSQAGLTVVGALDFGIGSCVLRGALDGKEGGGPTVALLSTGPDVAYPASLREVWGQICESGLVLSELPPGATPWNWSTRARGRIMAAIAGTTVVVEDEASGHSSQVAVQAAALGRRVAAVPNEATAAKGLLGLGASPIRNAEDLLTP